VPIYVQFGDEVYQEGVGLSNAGFYHKLATSFVHPSTSHPTPQDFASVYSGCSKKAEAIVSIHVSDKISGTYNSARHGKKMTKGKCQIEIIDSQLISIGLALVVMSAAKLAEAGENLQSILEKTRKTINQVKIVGIFDTLKYLVLGGRVSKATATIADILQIKPLLTFKNDEIVRESLARTYSRGMDRLYEFVADRPNIQDLAIAYSTVPEQANQMKKRLSSVFPEEKIHVTWLGSALGVHGGPGALVLAFRQGE